MAHSSVFTALFFLSVLGGIQLSTSHVLEAKLSCLDCHGNYDFSGIKVQVRCALVKKPAIATTEENGSFKVEVPSNRPQNCLAMLLGGPNQLYTWNKSLVTRVVKDHELNSYTISSPLAFYTSCPLDFQGAKCADIGSSKTVDLPLPPEWGLAPSSYYVPFFPIIGIP